MTTETLTQLLAANTKAFFGQGRVLYVKSLSGAVGVTITIRSKFRRASSVTVLRNIGAGFKLVRAAGDEWQEGDILSTVGQTIEFILSDDDVDVANAVSVTGTANVNQVPNSSFANTPKVTIANTAQGAVFAANVTRKAITIFSANGNAGYCQIRTAGGVNNIGEIAPGGFLSWRNTDGLDIRNDSGANADFYILEES